VPVRFRPYGAAVSAVLVSKLALSFAPKRRTRDNEPAGSPLAAVVVAVYNEDTEVLSDCLNSLCFQQPVPRSVTVVDDASGDRRGYDVAVSWTALMRQRGIDFNVLRHRRNMGKRQAMATAFALHPDAGIYVCAD